MKKIIIFLILGLCFYNIAFVINFDKKSKDGFKLKTYIEIISLKEETEYYNRYIVVRDGDRFIVYLNKNKNYYPGDIIQIDGVFNKAEEKRNYGGFNYREYLRQKKIYGIIKSENEKYIRTNKDIYFFIGKLQNCMKLRLEDTYSNDISGFLQGVLLGNVNNIDDDIKDDFRKSSISHILAISGLHITYLVLFFKKVLNIFIKSKRKKNIFLILLLVFFPVLTGMSASCVRACTMTIIMLINELIYKRNDFFKSFILSFIILIFINPFNIFSIGMWLSFLGTFGIVEFSDFLSKIFFKKIKHSFKILSTCISAQIMIFPVLIYSFNQFSLSFFIPNFFISFLIGPILCIGYLSIIIPFKISFLIKIEEVLVKLVLIISKVCSKIPYSIIYIKTPNIILVISYYIFIFYIIISFNKNKFYYLRCVILKKIPKQIKKSLCIFLLIIIIFNININKDLKIFFVDVGQGDCTVITTPGGKNIIIDGGEDFEGKIVLPYLLDRGITKINYMIVSHFDSDHAGGLLSVMEELKVNTVVISKQWETSSNFEKLKDIAKEKKMKIAVAETGYTLKVEKDLSFYFLWPNDQKTIQENLLNNNSLVCKLKFRDFSMLFTGDIEGIAEKQLLEEYKNNLQLLNSTILKVAHHGSNTSSIQEFVDIVNPKIAFIGVGKNNKFGHPNDEVINRLKNNKSKIYRTDKMGEIIAIINKKGEIKIKKLIE